MAALSHTSLLALGLVRRGLRTGYEMKQVLDGAAGFFWSTSYGQLYPELRRLETAGLLVGTADAVGGRKRTAYALTDAGNAALDAWLDDNTHLETVLRAEGLLKLLLARDEGPERQLGIVRAWRAQVEQQRDALARVEPPREVGRRIRSFGVQAFDLAVAWCDEVEAAILAGELDDG